MIKTSVIDPEMALRIVRGDHREIAYDTETDGLLVTSVIVGYVITSWEVSIYVPVRHEAGGNIPNVEEFEEALAAAFAQRCRLGYRTVGHNLAFDLRASLRRNIVIGSPVECTQINEALIDDTTIGYGLDVCAERRGVTAKKGEELYRLLASRFGGLPDRSSMKHYWRIEGDNPVAVDYATGDGVSTLELWRAQQPLLDEEMGRSGNLRRPWKLECDLMPYVAKMHHRGLKVNMEYAGTVIPALKKQVADLKQENFTPGFNVRAPSEVEALYRQKGYQDADFSYTDPTAKHPKGQISFREKWLETNQIGKAILDIRRLEKAEDSFIAPLVDTQNINGRVHPVLHQSKGDEYGVAGARFSCSEPNLQAFPKRNKEVGAIVRPLIMADDGMVLEEADAMQQEPRLFTHYSEDEALIAGYTAGTMDIHDRASEVLHLERDYAKRLGLGMLTMMSPKTLAVHMNYGIDEARRDHNLFLNSAFPKIRDFQQLAVRVYKQRGFVNSILGRRAWCRDPRFAYQAVSRIIQNGGGDHLKTCLLLACQYAETQSGLIEMLLTIHDSLIWQRDPGAIHVLKEVVRIVESVPHRPEFNLIVPIPFEVGSGDNWAEASYMHKIPGNGKELKGKKGWIGSLAA